MNTIAIIPARGGSKGLPNKNIRLLAGHPLIAYSIKVAQKSKLIDRVIVSTDSQEIAQVAKNYGAEVPFMRPSEFAQDQSRDYGVFKHAVDWLSTNEGYRADIIVQLRPTSPIRFAARVDQAVQQFMDSKADSLRAVTISPNTPYKMWVLSPDEKAMEPLLRIDGVKEPYNEPRQALPKVYWQTGTLDIFTYETLIDKKSLTGDSIIPFVIDTEHAVDIDDIISFRKAEEIISNSKMRLFED